MKKLLKLFILFMLIFFPFQISLVKSFQLPFIFRWIDEIFFLICLFFMAIMATYTGRIKNEIFILSLMFSLFVIYGMFSGIYNGNNFLITVAGIFDYLKYFIFIPAIGFFSFTENELKNFYRISIGLVIFTCLTSIIIIMCSWLGIAWPKFLGQIIAHRFGLPRPAPFYIHPNTLGLYSVIFFIIDFSLNPRLDSKKSLLLFGIFFSVSRMVYLSFIIGIYLLLVKSEIRNKAYYLMFMSFLGLAILMPVIIKMSWAEIVAERFYRGYVIKKSWEIWSDNPFPGVGPGMYGGVVSVEFKSPIYDKYHFSEYWYNFGLKTFHSLDQFWPQIMVELSLPGLAMFLMILFLLSGIAMKKYKLVQSDYAKKFSLGLMIIPIIIFFYLFGSGLNLSCLGTYAILYGVLLGAKKE